ncbi:MAG: hypothetical protein QNJ34_17830 [Xenococcaceae cyanobacterium MO_188.B29]|nr:hypothetical protein [Xenococcaceae cyanobacterium MO_188.B29]
MEYQKKIAFFNFGVAVPMVEAVTDYWLPFGRGRVLERVAHGGNPQDRARPLPKRRKPPWGRPR